MTKTHITVFAILVIMMLIVVGMLVARIGGSALRTSGQIYLEVLTLANNQVLPGTPVKLAYNRTSDNLAEAAALLLLRTPTNTIPLAQFTPAQLAGSSLTATVPCPGEGYEVAAGDDVSFLLVNNGDKSVIAQSELANLLPAGPECFFSK